MASAFEYAESGGQPPHEIELLGAIDRFGVAGVYGRALGAGEIRRMRTAENIIRSHREMRKAENPAEWAKKNHQAADLLAQAARAATDGD